MNPQKTYDSLRNDFTNSGLIDSLKIIGRPITVSSIHFHIDTSIIKKYNVSIGNVKEQIAVMDKSTTLNELMDQFIINDSGQKVPIHTFIEFKLMSEYYEPEIYVPNPEVYYYHDKKAVKIELYCKKENEKKLIEFVSRNISDYSHRYNNEYWSWEVVKTKIRSHNNEYKE
ncbi:MAG: hypothetical protein JXB49_02275 [Bacteroidales bacterium]|nr:hypothetical protein [Bacteroidales bacterium]